jgi:hypothetical protein
MIRVRGKSAKPLSLLESRAGCPPALSSARNGSISRSQMTADWL